MQKPTFQPDILDLTRPLIFPPVLKLRPEQIAERQPAPEVVSGPWYQYATRVMSAFHEDHVTDDLVSFFARALAEAHAMGTAGMDPLKPGQPRAGYTVKEPPRPVAPTRVSRRVAHVAEHAPTTTAPAAASPPKRVVRPRT